MSSLLTVLLPAYNTAPYLKEAIDSVLQQTYTDFELLIVNDGSTDETDTILASYSDPRIRIVKQDNIGLVKTLNKGLHLATGKYIARFDADDVCYPTRLQEQIDFLQQHDEYVMVGSEADYIDEDGNYIFSFKFGEYEDEEIRIAGFKDCPVIHSSVTFLKQAVIDAGGYDERAVTFEDHLLWRKLSEYGKIKNVHHPLIKVRFNASSVTIDEKWRGKSFIELKQRSIQSGEVTDADHELLIAILEKQNFTAYKKAAYHSMLGKKFLWNQHKPLMARQHLRKAIANAPYKAEPYLLYLFSFMPGSIISAIYKQVKK